MKGIHCALQGRLGADVELSPLANSARLSVGVGEGKETVWVGVAVFEEKARAERGGIWRDPRPMPPWAFRRH